MIAQFILIRLPGCCYRATVATYAWYVTKVLVCTASVQNSGVDWGNNWKSTIMFNAPLQCKYTASDRLKQADYASPFFMSECMWVGLHDNYLGLPLVPFGERCAAVEQAADIHTYIGLAGKRIS